MAKCCRDTSVGIDMMDGVMVMWKISLITQSAVMS